MKIKSEQFISNLKPADFAVGDRVYEVDPWTGEIARRGEVVYLWSQGEDVSVRWDGARFNSDIGSLYLFKSEGEASVDEEA